MELPTFKIVGELPLRQVEMFSDDRICDILNRAQRLGFDLDVIPSPLEDLTLRELDILTRDTQGSN
jgi:hypothetical protein